MWECDGKKRSRPDGYNFNFIKNCWETLKPNIIRIFLEFHTNFVISKGGNALFVALRSLEKFSLKNSD